MEDLLAAAGLRRADVDRLGEAMRRGELTEDSLIVFRRYGEAFRPALAEAVGVLRGAGATEITERHKTLRATVAKLRRSTARLSQVQDIAGCRLIVTTVVDQDEFVNRVLESRPGWRVHDRRVSPSHGYRAVHVIAGVGGLAVELQIRTELQHLWAELSEAWDRVYEGVKYGQGPDEVLASLARISNAIQRFDGAVTTWQSVGDLLAAMGPDGWPGYYERLTAPRARTSLRELAEEAGLGPDGPRRFLSGAADHMAALHTYLEKVVLAAFPTDETE